MVFPDIEFDSDNHCYSIGGTKLRGVTTIIKALQKPFETDVVSKRVAKRDGKTQEAVVAEWDAKGDVAKQKGSQVHQYVEDCLTGRYDPVLAAVNTRIPEMDAFDKAWVSLQKLVGATVSECELIVGDLNLLVAGRVDVIISVDLGEHRKLCIFDWKTGKFRTENSWEQLYPPFDDLDNCELSIHSLQTSLYRLIYERCAGVEMGDSYIAHLLSTGVPNVIKARDYRERWEKYLTNGKISNIL